MYLHLGQGTVVREDEVVGIFDMDTSTVSKKTRDFLNLAEKQGRVFYVTDDLPKTFVVCKKGKKEIVYISQISSSTLLKRAEEKELLK